MYDSVNSLNNINLFFTGTVFDRGQIEPVSDEPGESGEGTGRREGALSGSRGTDPGVGGSVRHPAVHAPCQTGTGGRVTGKSQGIRSSGAIGE